MKLKGQLYDTAVNVNHEDLLSLIASDLFNEIVKDCKFAARYGDKKVLVHIEKYRMYECIPPGCEKKVEEKLASLLLNEKLVLENGSISWEGEPNIPRITCRDLIDAGYPVKEELFGNILRALKTAIANGEVPQESATAQIIWVKKRFNR